MTTVNVAIVQASPVYYNLAQTVEKATDLIRQAASDGADLITFGETFFPGYPAWLDIAPHMGIWDSEATKTVWTRVYHNSVMVEGTEMMHFSALAKELGVVLVLPANERVAEGAGQGTLYNSIFTLDADGRLVNHHRKLVPTYTERIVWGAGDGAGVKAVDTRVGRVGGIVCWEHWMPLARQALHTSGEQIHIATWPTVKEMHQVASRHYAHEGRTFVLATGSLTQAKDLPPELPVLDSIQPDDYVVRGGSAIIAPDGSYLAEPVYEQEVIISAELDLEMVVRESMALDVTGHYSRPDVFTWSIDRSRR